MSEERLNTLFERTAQFHEAVHAHIGNLVPVKGTRYLVAFQAGPPEAISSHSTTAYHSTINITAGGLNSIACWPTYTGISRQPQVFGNNPLGDIQRPGDLLGSALVSSYLSSRQGN